MHEGQIVEPGPGEKVTCVQSGQNGGPFIFDFELGPKGKGPPVHRHDECDETIEVKSGQIVFVVNGQKHVLQPGERLTLTPQDRHTFYNPSKTDKVVCHVIHGARFERAIEQPTFTEMAMLITYIDPGATRIANPFIRAVLWGVATLGRMRGVQMPTAHQATLSSF